MIYSAGENFRMVNGPEKHDGNSNWRRFHLVLEVIKTCMWKNKVMIHLSMTFFVYLEPKGQLASAEAWLSI